MAGVASEGRTCVWAAALAALLLAASLGGPGSALAAEPVPAHDFATYRPTAAVKKIDRSQAPVIDGDISDATWANATVIDEFYALEPVAGATPSERTVVRVMYDDDNLYLAVYAYDREPDLLVRNIKQRDGNIGQDDFFRIYLDPNLTRRDSYMFEINALGARSDALGQNNSGFIKDWDMIWSASSKIVADGWTAEVAFPFRSLSYDPEATDWGFDFQRNIRRKGERIRWSSVLASLFFTDVSRAGTLTGISPVREDLGLDIQTYERFTFLHDWKAPTHQDTLLGRFSGNAFYKILPTLTGTLTVNPDFSDAPLDQRQVNLTRFALFQPETRDFFLQDAATFEYGGRGFVNGDNNARPFFSRNIGLGNGRPVAIVAGGKISGSYRGFGIGALSVLTSGTGLDNRGQVLSVARMTAPVFAESKAGIVFTNGDPNGQQDNTVVGTDFQYRNSNLLPGQIFQSDFYYQRSFSGALGDDDSFGAALNYPNEPLNAWVAFKQVGKNFNPALGFINREAIRAYTFSATHRDRTQGWRWLDFVGQGTLITDLDDQLETAEVGVSTGINDNAQDQYYIRAFHYYEDVPTQFKLAGTVPVLPGSYHWTNGILNIQTNNGRSYSGEITVFCCSFYNGNYLRIEATTLFKFNETLQLAPRWTATFIDLPTGAVNVHVLATDILINFTPDMSLLTQIQFDNISRNFGMSSRYSWEYSPGQEIFAAFVHSALVPGTDYEPQTAQFSIRFGQTFRF